jgi:hypothetical protein
MNRTRFGRSALIVVGLAVAAFVLPAMVSASASATNGTGHCDLSSPTCGVNPILNGPPPPFVTIPANCPAFLSTDAWNLNFVSGNGVFHDTTNTNGDWFGFTGQGQAQLATSDNTVQYAGHLTAWFGSGNNSGAQTENGFTMTFNGSGIAGSLSIHVESHMTTSNSGTPTATAQHVTVTCS